MQTSLPVFLSHRATRSIDDMPVIQIISLLSMIEEVVIEASTIKNTVGFLVLKFLHRTLGAQSFEGPIACSHPMLRC